MINCWLAEIDHSCNCCNTSWHHPKSWFLIAMLFWRSYVICHINHKLFIKFILISHQRITCISFSLRVISYSLQSTFRLTLHAAWLQVFFREIWILTIWQNLNHFVSITCISFESENCYFAVSKSCETFYSICFWKVTVFTFLTTLSCGSESFYLPVL